MKENNKKNNLSKKKIVVIGAGISGLTIAYKLVQKGFDVTLIEKEKKVGGLARSFTYGDFTFDIGPHRFHTDFPDVDQFIKDVLDNEYHTILRKSSVFLFGILHKWPLRPSSLIKLPFKTLLGCFIDLFRNKEFTGESFKDYIISKYGKTLFHIFFEEYTYKYCNTPPENLHYTWASASIDRAIIDKNIKVESLLDTLKVALLPKPVTTLFIYPKYGGIQTFSDMLLDKFQKLGGKIKLDTECQKVEHDGKRIKSIILKDSTKLPIDHLVWTPPLPILCGFLGMEKPKLRYLSLIIYNTVLKKRLNIEEQWIYFPNKDLKLTRMSFPRNFSEKLVPEGHDSICVEFTTTDLSHIADPEAHVGDIVKDLEYVGLCKKDDIQKIHIEAIPNAYPIYDMGYKEILEKAILDLKTFGNLTCSGRCGLFWYNNMDNSIQKGISDADAITYLHIGNSEQK
jgi:protoporphyrinogen oxidase